MVGADAPAFSLPASTGRTVGLADFKGKKQVVLVFFPKAFSGGCTKEMTGLQDHIAMFEKENAQIIGISPDGVETQKKFAEALKLTFPVLSDRGGKVASKYGVMGALWPARTTFVIDEEGKVRAVVEGKDAIDPAVTLASVRRPAVR